MQPSPNMERRVGPVDSSAPARVLTISPDLLGDGPKLLYMRLWIEAGCQLGRFERVSLPWLRSTLLSDVRSERTVARYLRELEAAKLVSVVRGFGTGALLSITLHARPVRVDVGNQQGEFEFMTPEPGDVPEPAVFFGPARTDLSATADLSAADNLDQAAVPPKPRREVPSETGEDAELARLINAKRAASASDSLNVTRSTAQLSPYVQTLERRERCVVEASEGGAVASRVADQPSSAPAAKEGTVFTGGLYGRRDDVRTDILAHAQRIWLKCDDRKLFPWVAILAAEQAAAGSFSRADLDGQVDSAVLTVRAGKANPGMRAGGLLVGWLQQQLGEEFVRYKSYRDHFQQIHGRWRHAWFTAADARRPGFWT